MAEERLPVSRLRDVELDALVASLDPLQDVPDGPLSEREEELLRLIADAGRATEEDTIVSHRARRGRRLRTVSMRAPRGRARRRLLSVTTAVALVVVGGVVAMSLLRPSDAVATVPHPLGVTAIEESADEVLDAAIDLLSREGGPAEAKREALSIWWRVSPADEKWGSTEPLVHPHITRFDWNVDGSGRMLTMSAPPYPSDGSTTTAADRTVPRVDTVVDDTTYAPGELETPFDGLELGDSVEDVTRILRVPESPAAWEVFQGVSSAFRSLTLSDAQQAQVLRLLKDASGLRVMGTATDRLGRLVVLLEATTVPVSDARETLHLSLETGRIVGAEYFLSAPLGKIPAGAVVLYTAWDVSGFLPQ
ncbi:hypothetical protein [Microbacterium sp.]|uniref:hypothetical protein n=1 Tax=Microbacterium sp. TaxID=51671 RepID=UPI0032217D5F